MLVLDCSLCIAWGFRDERTPAALTILERVAQESIVVPSIWALEVGNAVLVSHRRGRFSDEDLSVFLRLLAALPIEVDEQPPERVFEEVLPLATEHGLSSYDAAYLELALRKASPLATLDAGLARAARTAGLEVLGAP